MLGKLFNRKPQIISRDGERFDVSLRVLSRELPGYRGVTLDLSSSGVQLETGGLLEVGSEPELKFEFDRGELESFACRAKVVWSKQDGANIRVFHSGLTFVPRTDDERRLVARMTTVMQTRSDSDLKTLLDQARLMDPELEKSYANLSTTPSYRPAAPAAQPEKVDPPAQSAPYPGWYMPLSLTLEGYTWNRASNTLHLGVKEGEQLHSLFFPDCQLFQVLEPGAEWTVVGMYSTTKSPVTRKLKISGEEKIYRHYRFVGEGGKGLVDIVAESCKPTGPSA